MERVFVLIVGEYAGGAAILRGNNVVFLADAQRAKIVFAEVLPLLATVGKDERVGPFALCIQKDV